ncbi:MAG: hypothetical protein KatS3mg082_2307 [Nitrospiraceae bacterium]|nr:MAG: hypothetical protein KatS3mg082_2307 [Nitrospiraceae bacterium]
MPAGMSTREITGHLRELYGIDVSPDLISTVTDAVLEEVAAWQARPLDPAYPLVFFDAIRVKIRDEGMVRNKAIHIALGVMADGTKVVLGLWIEQNEGAKFWLRVMNELKNRGVEDIMLAVVDGLKGFPDAITAVFPEAIVQTCIVHLLRNSMDFVSWKHRKPLAAALKGIYRAVDAKAAEEALTAFEASEWGRRYPAIGQSWRRAWSRGHPFLRLPGGGPQDRLHDQCYRGSERPASAGGEGQGALPQRRSSNQATLSDLEPLRERVENAAT